MSTRIIKVLSLILTLAILINLLPASAIAQTLQESNTASSETGEVAETSAEDVRILSENTDKRTAFTKDYKLSNGFNMSVVYPEVVHFEENGQWKEIDNTLKASGTGTNAVYTNTTGGWNAVFPQQLTKNSRVSVVKNGYAVSFGMAGELRSSAELMSENGQASRAASAGEELSVTQMQTATAQIAQRASAEELAEMEHPEIVREKLYSRLTYEDVYSNIDIVYDLNGYQLKESVVINSYDSKVRGYQYVLETGSLTPVLNEDGSIDLFAPGTEEPIMEMPAPYMVDSSGAVSYDVDISLVPQDGNYMLTYRMPTAWLADSARVWPVVLDPAVIACPKAVNIMDRTVASTAATTYTDVDLWCGVQSVYGITRTYIKYVHLPVISSADVVVNATLSLYARSGTSGSTIIEAHTVTEKWTSEDISWSDQPDFDGVVEDYANITTQGIRYSWDVTNAARRWYSDANHGVVLKVSGEKEAAGAAYNEKFFSVDHDKYKPQELPQLMIIYRNANGLESYWDYTTTSAGRAGTGYVNNYSGNLTWARSDLGFGGNLMPVAISHVYNTSDAQSNTFGLGYGWRTNYHQTVSSVALVDDGNNELTTNANYVWEDGDGTKHYFVSKEGKYVDEDGLELELTVSSSGYTITDKNGNTSNFDARGRLISLVNNQQTKRGIYIAYQGSSNRIEELEDGAGRVYKFTYTNNLLTRIGYWGKGSREFAYVTFGYTGLTLTSVTDKDGETVTYAYGTGNLLTAAQDIDGYKLEYSYCTTEPKRVVSINEYDGTTAGGTLTFAYSQNQTTLTDHNNNKQILQFNDWGNVISIQDNEGHAQFAQYAANWHGETGKTSNQLTLSSKMQNTVVSYFKDKSFENGTTWSALSSAVTCSNSTTTAYYGSKSLKMTRATAGAATGVRYMGGYIESGVTVSFSAWVKTDSTASAWLQITSATGETVQSEVLPSGSDWTRLEVALTPSTNARVYPELITETAGTVYMDCVQFEKAASASRYNLIDNGDFRYDLYDWGRGTGLTTADNCAQTNQSASAKMSTAAFPITGNPTGQKYLYQTVKVSGSAGDCYVLGGWAKGDSVPLGEVSGVNREFGLKLIFNNTDSSKTTRYVSFNCDLPSSGNWQYAATAAVAEKPYSSITVQLVYNYNANTVYFDGIQLFKEQFGSSYTYDSNGNVTKVEDLQKQETTYEYTNNNLTEIIQNGNAKMTYVYDAYHNVTKATTGEGLVYEFIYDQYGNNTSVSIVNGNTRITSSAVYSTNGNLLVSTKDALDKTTTYGYNEDTNVLEWVKYPNDTNATRTEYSYDSMYRLASSSVDLDPNTTLSVSYTYTDDLLTKIQTASTTYNFSYGDFSQRTGVSVGTQVLASYAYTNDKNRYLQRLTYGNGDYVQYTYDSHGRVVRETYEDGSTVSYAYDNSGALATVTDSETGITTKYYYDLTDRMMKYVESGDGYSHSVGYEYDTLNNLTHLVETINGVKHTTEYGYDGDNRVTSITNGIHNGTVNQEARRDYIYDDFGRVTQRVTKQNGTQLLTETITYVGNSTQVASITTVSDGYSVTYSYTYDNNGNISTVSDGTYCTQYFYDAANQLIRENNQQGNFTCVWIYDDAGNILNRTMYPYTTGEPGQAQDSFAYTYGDSEWGDLLNVYDGIPITYDEIGNPLTKNGYTVYTWKNGRQLATAEGAMGYVWTYTYDANGMRIGKQRDLGGPSYSYVYNGGQLMQMRVGTDTYSFTYDAGGTPMTISHNGTVYYYVTNLQGDVVAIVDSTGVQVVGYTYDAWGKVLSQTGTMAWSLGEENPLRYRGYVYDPETGLYYLQSRYYDPEVGRFINADDIGYLGAGSSLTSYNLFAYCGNNPIMGYDPTGTWDWGTAFSGATLLATGLIAVSVAATILTCGAAAPLMVAVATVTFAAGTLTAINGVAEVVEAGSGYNFVRDGTFGGNTMAYESYRDTTAAIAEIGTAICGTYYAAKGGNVCFVAGTLVQTEQGAIPIETVTVGTRVWAWDEETGNVALKEVVETYVNQTDELVHIFVDGEEIISTPTHPFYSPVKGWTDACKLRAGDILVLVNGDYVVVEKVQHEILEAPVTVYNFQVEDYHTYFVADIGVLVHNKCGMTNKEATVAAKELGYSKVPNTSSHGNAVFTNSKAPRSLRYITADADVHSGGVWKAADTIANLGSKATRSGTYNALLEWLAP